MNAQERSMLIDAMLEGDISEADFLRLEAELSVDPQVRAEYYDRLKLQVLLQRIAEETPHAESATGEPSSPGSSAAVRHERPHDNKPSRPTRPGSYLLAATGLLALAAGLFLIVRALPESQPPSDAPGMVTMVAAPAESKAVGFALLGGQSNAVWEGPSQLSNGLLPDGSLHLLSGLAHIELFSGVQMVIQGEALFSIESAMQVRVAKGRIRAYVPEAAKGFRMLTQQGAVLETGSEFAIDVDADGTQVNVLDEDLESIVSPQQFHQDQDSRLASRMRQWQSETTQRQQTDGLLAYYQPERTDRWSRVLVNRSQAATMRASDGAIVAAQRARDRWGRDDGALDFSRTGSRVRVDVPGQYPHLTMLCWVKINSLDRWYNSLFLTDGHEPHEPHWQIMNDGRLFFSVKADRKTKGAASQHVFYSEPFWDASLSGKWIMLAVVYDTQTKRVTHYLNGQPLGREAIPDSFLVDTIEIGAASIGNWSQPMYRTDPEFAVRNLNGSMDEFAMFSTALTDQQILDWYQAGNPHE
ncbi:LamG domain-containing protein [Roseimaritima ulvae]|uniref:FecR protein n=1 Tax=Roseimaritima ulvae TaxID=980254 RepID=A0A5B9QPI8_9BACT|nr:LamG domain-containing protein [Roseimaritima ulvae]QEG39839.1 FecR protein [Roseimaritima ulvae]